MLSTPAGPRNGPRTTFYLAGVMFLLCVSTFFEGYDFFIISLIIDLVAKDFNAPVKTVLTMVGVVNVGAILAFFVIRLGDRVGRKPLLLMGVAGYAGLSLLTAFSTNLYMYVALQFLGKIFLVTEFGMAIIMVAEEYPPKVRAKCVAVLEVAGAIGGGAAMVSSKYALEAWGWRGMYWIGSIPLVLLPVMALCVKETRHFLSIKDEMRKLSRSLWHIWTTPSRRMVILCGAMWFLCYLAYAGVVYHWVLFAKTERGFSEGDVGTPMALASLVGMSGYVVSGAMMDWLGRRPTAIAFFVGSAGSLVWAFTAPAGLMIPSVVVAMFFIFAVIPICSTFNTELFPTDLRSDAFGQCNYLLGRPAQSLAPVLVAQLSAMAGGVGNAVCFLAAGPLLAAILVWKLLPETKGIQLDKIH